MDLKLEKACANMILSPSGWRGIFAFDGDAESAAPEISQAHRAIAVAAAKAFSGYVASLSLRGAIIVGRDTRPTGAAIADAVIGALIAEGRETRYASVVAAPEIMAFAQSSAQAENPAAGFIYISASHNPIGFNGIKFGFTDGGVISAKESAVLVAAFRALLDKETAEGAAETANPDETAAKVTAVYAASEGWKQAATAAYREFAGEVISGIADSGKRGEFFAFLRKEIEKHPLGIAADFNGSARTLSIDREFFSSLGITFFAINDTPGRIAHRIVPEGDSLEPCRVFLRELHGKNPSVTVGYVPDCDGDRGNLVIAVPDNGGTGSSARILEAQEVFALTCMAELAFLVWSGELKVGESGTATKAAIVANDPTSLRIDHIAEAFGARVFRAEVGEANVVSLARELRRQGYTVRVSGEGSAGGSIIHPQAVRDPLATLGALVKLLAIRGGRGRNCEGANAGDMGLFEIWCSLSGQNEIYRQDFTLADVVASLPKFATTGAYTSEALLEINADNREAIADHGEMKARYQKIFLR
ncbi:MAG: phosphatidylglycerol lysyltransferase, partial [Treponema sp.]|nr:phosphatidylglycerol lysyltransferase [Treponema sp.]